MRATLCRCTLIFLPTPSARRATPGRHQVLMFHVISTHALREEGDVHWFTSFLFHVISTHALREEGDRATAVYDLEKE